MIPFQKTQQTPWAQITCALMGIEGWAENIKIGATDPVKGAEKIRELHSYIMDNFPAYFEKVAWPEEKPCYPPGMMRQ